MKRLYFPIILFSALLLTSCAFHSGMMTGNANLGDADFQVLTMGVGTAKTTQVFGIGGLDKQALVYEAKKNLYRAYPLGKNHVYSNVTVDFKRSLYIIVYTTMATVTADLVQFGDVSAADSAKYSLNSSSSAMPGIRDSTNIGLFYPGQIANIYEFQYIVPVRILEKIPGKDKYKVEYTELNSGETKKVKESDLYLSGKNDSIPGTDFRVGDPISFSTGSNTQIQTGVVFALGTKYLIVKSGVYTLRLKIENCISYGTLK